MDKDQLAALVAANLCGPHSVNENMALSIAARAYIIVDALEAEKHRRVQAAIAAEKAAKEAEAVAKAATSKK